MAPTADHGFRLRSHPDGWTIEVWAPDRPTCMAEAMRALVATFADVPETAAAETLAVAADAGSDAAALISLLEETLNVADVFGLVVVHAHLADAEDGGVAGDMEVVPAGEVEMTGPVPTAVSHADAEIGERDGAWRGHVVALR